MKKTLAGIVLLCIMLVGASGGCADVDYLKIGFDIMKNEAVGFLKIGLAAAEVLAGLGEPADKSPIRIWGADGLEHQKWRYPAKGIEFDMVKRDGAFLVNMISITTPCEYKTKQGIGIGSSAKEVQAAYPNQLNPAVNDTKLVAGTVYGGIIFGMEGGAVSSIFIGAAAE
jgi:hypothetical protein